MIHCQKGSPLLPLLPRTQLGCSVGEAVKEAITPEDLQGPGKGLPSARAKFEAQRR